MTTPYERWRTAQAEPARPASAPRVLLVDDEPHVLEGLRAVLSPAVSTHAVRDGFAALEAIERHGPFAAVVSDMRMPGMDGAAFLAVARSMDPRMVRVLLTGHADAEATAGAVNDGQIFRLLYKPCPPARLREVVALAVQEHRRLAREHRLVEVALSSGIRALARAVDARDDATEAHSERVGAVAARIARERAWDEAEVAALRDAALVHDVGKIGVPDAILRKTGPLDAGERRLIQGHAALGARILEGLMAPDQLAWVRHHHERYDGTGYPDGLAGDAIPEGARILAVADVLDVMTSDRCYRRAGAWDQAVAECARVAGAQLCPAAVAAARRLRARGALPPRPERVPR